MNCYFRKMNTNNESVTVIEKYTVFEQCNVDHSERETIFTFSMLNDDSVMLGCKVNQ